MIRVGTHGDGLMPSPLFVVFGTRIEGRRLEQARVVKIHTLCSLRIDVPKTKGRELWSKSCPLDTLCSCNKGYASEKGKNIMEQE